MRGALVLLICGALVAGCADEQENIQQWMSEQAVGMRGAVKPIPEIKIYPVVDFAPADTLEPFNVARIEPAKPDKPKLNDPRLDPDRQREPLEAFPLESLKMVGVLRQGKEIHALIQADNALYQVHVGNFMGRNYGKVTAITDEALELQELIEDMNDGWVERISSLQLQERQEAGR
ncbi:MAG: pilus assembly protein PilP [Azoarcus sp.]|jgi:type IV pilus assembly protein PilP|nr:pilus assembly protein PilP [Azoarcus sp.]